VRFKGEAKKLLAEASDSYWNKRHRDSQLSQWVSQQSKTVTSREQMESELKLAQDKFKDAKTIPRPQHWGGYEIHLTQVEFWIGHPARFHDRFLYTLSQDRWSGSRLYP
jgi:pyridoxamine 5'-phosphate oxidase